MYKSSPNPDYKQVCSYSIVNFGFVNVQLLITTIGIFIRPFREKTIKVSESYSYHKTFQAIFKALNRPAFIVKENKMKEQWKPLNGIGNNDYPIWLGQEENGQFVLLDERRWTLDL